MTAVRSGEAKAVAAKEAAIRASIPAIARLITDPEYSQHRGTLSSFLGRSRAFRDAPDRLLELQAEMARALLEWQKSQRSLRGELTKADSDERELKELRVTMGVSKRLQQVLRQIADGIAWRALSYDRATLYQLALRPPSGHLEFASILGELKASAGRLVKTGEMLVLNDLTNVLRYGDYTAVGDEGITIVEVKAGRGSAKSGRATKQKRDLREILQFIRHGERLADGRLERIVYLQEPPRHQLPSIEHILAEAKRKGSSSARLSSSVAVEAIDAKVSADRWRPGQRQTFENPFAQSNYGLSFHSMDVLPTYSANVAPYSIFPLPEDQRLDLMTGAVWLITYFNVWKLIRCLRRRGLLADVPTDAAIAAADNLKPALMVSKGRRDPVLLISQPELCRLVYEFLDEECFVDTVVEQLDRTSNESPELVYAAYAQEAAIWD